MTTSGFLIDHGTRAFELPPSAVLHAAEHDIAIRGRKDERRRLIAENRPAEGEAVIDPFRPYAFHRTHVRKAEDARNLLRLALSEPQLGLESGKVNTRLLYGSPDLLRKALAA